MVDVTKMEGCDLTPRWFAYAVGLLGVMPAEVTLLCPSTVAADAQEIADKYRCAVVLLPVEMLVDKEAWAVGFGNQFVWAEGA